MVPGFFLYKAGNHWPHLSLTAFLSVFSGWEIKWSGTRHKAARLDNQPGTGAGQRRVMLLSPS
jgi:hypothetical protein